MRCVRDFLGVRNQHMPTAPIMSGSSMGYSDPTCQANVETGGKEHTRYRPCGERMVFNHKADEYICPIHGPMK